MFIFFLPLIKQIYFSCYLQKLQFIFHPRVAQKLQWRKLYVYHRFLNNFDLKLNINLETSPADKGWQRGHALKRSAGSIKDRWTLPSHWRVASTDNKHIYSPHLNWAKNCCMMVKTHDDYTHFPIWKTYFNVRYIGDTTSCCNTQDLVKRECHTKDDLSLNASKRKSQTKYSAGPRDWVSGVGILCHVRSV